MYFVVIAYDYPDAKERRLANRQAHFELIDELKAAGQILIGGALQNDAGEMIGSVLVGDFASREAMEQLWFSREPYLTGNVWENVQVNRYGLGPAFLPQPAP